MIKHISHCLQKFKCIIREAQSSFNILIPNSSSPCADVMSTRVLLKRGTENGMEQNHNTSLRWIHLHRQCDEGVIWTKVVYICNTQKYVVHISYFPFHTLLVIASNSNFIGCWHDVSTWRRTVAENVWNEYIKINCASRMMHFDAKGFIP